ncbi:MAG: YfcC family protein [Clostridia bacterium]|nr:YfcC family protein [Clostridia bacterium]
MDGRDNLGLRIGRRTFLVTATVLLAVLVLAGWLTLALPRGAYDRVLTDGREAVVPGSYHVTPGDRLPVWRWFTAPVEVLGSDDAAPVLMIIAFVLLIGGTFQILEQSGVLRAAMGAVVARFSRRRYLLLALTSLVCMLLGSAMGLFEETVTLVPFSIALAVSLGWDRLVGVGMSVLAVGCGFAAGTVNPFTIGVAQRLAGLPAFSGILLRVGVFAAVYALLILFLLRYAKRVEADPSVSLLRYGSAAAPAPTAEADADVPVARKGAFLPFATALGLIFLFLLVSSFTDGLGDFALPVMAVLMTAGGILSGYRAGMPGRRVWGTFARGTAALAPGALLILLAMGAKQTLTAGGVMDTVLHEAYLRIEGTGPYVSVLLMYLFILVLELFVGSSTAKAFLVMPLLVPLADLLGVTRQTVVQAFAFGDGFVNMAYPTNAVLLITLGIAGIPFSVWFRWTWILQAALAGLACLVLALCVAIGYGPF